MELVPLPDGGVGLVWVAQTPSGPTYQLQDAANAFAPGTSVKLFQSVVQPILGDFAAFAFRGDILTVWSNLGQLVMRGLHGARPRPLTLPSEAVEGPSLPSCSLGDDGFFALAYQVGQGSQSDLRGTRFCAPP